MELFPALAEIPFLRHGFTGRVPGVDVKFDRELSLSRLDKHHAHDRESIGIGELPLVFAQQVHGCEVAVVSAATPSPVAGADGLLTASPNVALGIYVADCCPVYLVDPYKRIIGLLHSGRKGTDLGISAHAISLMVEQFGSIPSDIVVQLGPCIRPPHYEVDISAGIREQCQAAGLRNIYDCGICTAANLERYYSYRAELGKTGRMLALLAMIS